MPLRSLLLTTVAWVATVAGACVLIWTVIAGAGARVGQATSVPPPATTGSVSPSPSPDAGQGWSGRSGRVTAHCDGDRVSLGTAVPAVGYRVEVGERGPERLRLEFEPEESDSGEEVHLEVTCVAGSPRFRRL